MTSVGPVARSIRSKLSQLNPSHLEVINESYMHKVPKDSESHLKVIVVSDQFQGVPPLKRHRMVHSLLKEELETSIHALSIVAKTAEQWSQCSEVDPSPKCRGGGSK